MAFQIIPPSRPQQSREKTVQQLIVAGWDITRYPVALLGVRGYYLDTMGDRGVNDRKLYDDAIFLVCPAGGYLAFNANTDPGAFREGIASLVPGRWLYRLGIHGLSKPVAKQYQALVQAASVTINRDERDEPYSGMFGINIHKGSRMSVSSLGCQTIWPGQWKEFIDTVRRVLAENDQTKVPYFLTEVVK